MTMSMPRGAARSQIVAKAAAHGGNVGLALLEDAAADLDLLDAEFGADLEQPVVHRFGGAALLAVEMPVHQELELDMADAVVGEDAAHGRQAVPGDRGFHVVEHEAHAAPADPSRDLGAVLQGKGADLARRARIDGAADRPVGRAELDVFDLHLGGLRGCRVGPVRRRLCGVAPFRRARRGGQKLCWPVAFSISLSIETARTSRRPVTIRRTSFSTPIRFSPLLTVPITRRRAAPRGWRHGRRRGSRRR